MHEGGGRGVGSNKVVELKKKRKERIQLLHIFFKLAFKKII